MTTAAHNAGPAGRQGPLRWFVTGASGGLGRHIVTHALAAGDYVVATARKPQALEDLSARYPRQLVVKTLDVARPDDISAVVTGVLSEFGHVDVVVNNAGYSIIGATEEVTDEQIRHQLSTMLHAPIQITRAFLESMRVQGSGRFIQISSVGGQVAFPVSSIYHAAKWGLEGFSEGVSKEVADFDIHFTLVEPGGMRTGFGANAQFTTETPAYKPTAVGAFRRRMANARDDVYIGDPAKFAAAI
jgi:NAD(P)-dependent dehydrogenase (short-subunit alcohol dehydrogenase family)